MSLYFNTSDVLIVENYKIENIFWRSYVDLELIFPLQLVPRPLVGAVIFEVALFAQFVSLFGSARSIPEHQSIKFKPR